MLKVLRSSADLQLYDSEFQTERALMLNAFADNASAIRGTVRNILSDDRTVRAGWGDVVRPRCQLMLLCI